MSKLTFLEQYYLTWKERQDEFKKYLISLEVKIQDLDERLSKLELENKEMKEKQRDKDIIDHNEKIWIKIRGYAIEVKNSLLLNPSKNYRFQVIEVSDDFIRVDKLGKVFLTKNMFIRLYNNLKETGEWLKIGASVKNTKPNTVEGLLKKYFFGGNMDGQMTAPWISALMVRADVGIVFNNKAIGQAIKYRE